MPGFRFHPTEEEILDFYLRQAAAGKKFNLDIIPTVNLYLYEPWDLPALAKIGEQEWYFFVPRDRRHWNSGRPNRTTEKGFWKATGTDRPIRSTADPRRLIGTKKTLVYYSGRAPRGTKTDWIMNEFRLPDASDSVSMDPRSRREDLVLCKIYRKAASLRELEQRAAMEEDNRASMADKSEIYSGELNFSYAEFVEEMQLPEAVEVSSSPELSSPGPEPTLIESSSVRRPPLALSTEISNPVAGRQPPMLPMLQVPNRGSFGWTKDSVVSQQRSPWLEQWSPLYALLNF